MSDAATPTPEVKLSEVKFAEVKPEAKPPEPAKVEGKEEKTEAKPEEKKDKLSQSFAQLAKKERGLVLRQQSLKEREAKFAEREAAIAAKEERVAQFEKLKAEAKLNPIAALEALGLTYEDATAYVLNDKKPTAELQARNTDDKFERWKKEQEENGKRAAEEEKKRLQAEVEEAKANHQRECDAFVDAHKDEYELLHVNAERIWSVPAGVVVSQIIRQHWEASKKAGEPKLLTSKEAADMAEKYLEETINATLATKKLQQRVEQKTQPQAEKRTDGAQPRTLTNGMATTSQTYAALSEDERIKRALAALDGRK